ncbi:MAG TPA: pantetheine-phosphate adenylyltransferase [Firmicutes bacterium]|jgi:pantetheine-phosphate adenylyltransferase|nr:pantetheine-phosphate adenylyltransferase [Bacillota bacterium]
MTIAICPGSFDPVTNGHLDIIQRAAAIFDKVIVAVLENPGKEPLFSAAERRRLLQEVVTHLPNVEVEYFQGLLVDYAKSRGARVIIKGLRAISDFESEFQMALTNKRVNPEIETMFMMTANEYSFLSSSMVKELVFFGGNPEGFVPPLVASALEEKFKHRRSGK